MSELKLLLSALGLLLIRRRRRRNRTRSDKECRRRWENLRATHRRYNTPAPAGGSGAPAGGSGAPRTGQQRILHQRHLIDPHRERRESTSTLTQELCDAAPLWTPGSPEGASRGTGSSPGSPEGASRGTGSSPGSPEGASRGTGSSPGSPEGASRGTGSSSEGHESTQSEELDIRLTGSPIAESTICEDLESSSTSEDSDPGQRPPAERRKKSRDEEVLLQTVRKTLEMVTRAQQQNDHISVCCKRLEHRLRMLPPHRLAQFEYDMEHLLYRFSQNQNQIQETD